MSLETEPAPTADGQERREKVRAFLDRYFRGHPIGDDEDIFARGFVNSLLAMQLIDYLEKEFGITVEDEDLDFDNFRTIRSIDAFVGAKYAETP